MEVSDEEKILVKTQRAAVLAASANPVEMSGKSSDMQDDGDGTRKLSAAIVEATGVIQMEPQSAYAYYNRGCLQAQAGRDEAAITDFTKAIDLDSRFAEAYFNRGVLYLRKGKLQQSIEDFSKAGELGLYQAYSLLKQARERD